MEIKRAQPAPSKERQVLVVGWPEDVLSALARRMKKGIVAVRYTPDAVEVLERCEVEGQYDYATEPAAGAKEEFHSREDLALKLPLGVVTLDAAFETAAAIEMEYKLVGSREAKPHPAEAAWQGDCERATHAASLISVGAYVVRTKGEKKRETSAAVAPISVGAAAGDSGDVKTKRGDLARCDVARDADKEPPEGCNAIVSLRLVARKGPK